MLKKIRKFFFRDKGFSLIELLIVVAILGILSRIVFQSVAKGRERANVAVSEQQQKILITAVELYYNDMGFYPPDVNRGWDPGLVRKNPWNPDIEAGDSVPLGYSVSGANCSHCPNDWESLLNQKWNGPYMSEWPKITPWKGRYDYNYWATGMTRVGCVVPPGIYVGIQGDYLNENTIPEFSEQEMVDSKTDADNCINGESQMRILSL